jgi:hypothetical protein
MKYWIELFSTKEGEAKAKAKHRRVLTTTPDYFLTYISSAAQCLSFSLQLKKNRYNDKGQCILTDSPQ